MKIESVIPILYSDNVARSIRYYTEVLGFEEHWSGIRSRVLAVWLMVILLFSFAGAIRGIKVPGWPSTSVTLMNITKILNLRVL